ncbi:WbqC family protein [Cytophagaceae bacterium DM2B3-1]|uniref:WbqC family protein n=1 Tax=Xanthocytophaga flava TaxID=3048013 RepID=A0ABT7CD24_9BACT|nr:WbqC family protein [Xanthocytophaga flavus]MDJ1470597.1 WbqC family protein [Xanthocytophaga flavus]MDJ1491560.1 WbqC family protein [Xanthocytophaga flavus]
MQEIVSNLPDSKSAYIELHYFPCLAYFACISSYESILLESAENYTKQSYRNRCNIRTANKVANLSVPVVKGNTKQRIKDIHIDYSENWIKDHWRTIASGYGKAPFFSELAPVFERILHKKHTFLFDLNLEILTNCLRILRWKKEIRLSNEYFKGSEVPNDFRDRIHPKKTELLTDLYKVVPYTQNFGSDFVPNLSILDILFCEGIYASDLICQSSVNPQGHNF